MGAKHERVLIAKEIDLGFLYITSEARNLFPNQGSKVTIYLGKSKKPLELSYNSQYHRVFGLTSWYHDKEAKPKDVVTIEGIDSGAVRIDYRSSVKETNYTEEEVEEIIDLSGLHSATKGDIVEDRIKDTILLLSQGMLSIYRPVVDAEGIDLIVVKSGVFQPIFLQVKSRFVLHGLSSFLFDIRAKNFKTHHSFYIIGAYFDSKELELSDNILFIPSKKIPELATKITLANGDVRYRVSTKLSNTTKSKWQPYVVSKKDLANILLNKFDEMEKYLK